MNAKIWNVAPISRSALQKLCCRKYADELKTVTVLPKPFTVAHLRRVVTEFLQKATA
jgi:hypothetical protein